MQAKPAHPGDAVGSLHPKRIGDQQIVRGVHVASVAPGYAGGVTPQDPTEAMACSSQTVSRRVRIDGTAQEVAERISRVAEHWCWLDGETGSPYRSYLAVASEVVNAVRGREQEFLDRLRGHAAHSVEGTPAGFHSGWVVALGYEFGVALLDLEPAPDDAPPALAMRIEVVLAIDHAAHSAELRASNSAQIDAWLNEFGHVLGSDDPTLIGDSVPAPCAKSPVWRQSDGDYRVHIEACREAIRDGDAYVLCLTDTATQRGPVASPVELYSRLRHGGGAARGGVIVTVGRALISASPERFLSLTRTVGKLQLATHPIKGTRPRGTSPEHDAALASELATDPKERAENLMIVDLMRNDFSRVCEPGSIAVQGFLRVESHPHVHQLVSTVVGSLREGADAIDAISACFPGGSMTGAPKRRAVEVLSSLESGPRGLYSGCFGWIDDRGEAELAMTIRGIEVRTEPDTGERTAFVGAGGGITADSVPELELAEKHLKAERLLAVLTSPRETP